MSSSSGRDSGGGPVRAAIYLRVSTKEQAEDNRHSLPTQEAACRAEASRLGWAVQEWHVYREALCGDLLDERPALTRPRAAIQRGEVDRVLVYDPDRLSREADDRVYLRVEARKRGAAYHFVRNGVGESAEDRLVDYIMGYAAGLELRQIRERTNRGKRARVERGLRLQACRPKYGYTWPPDELDAKGRLLRGRLIENPATARVVRRIFRDFVAGVPILAIAKALTHEGVPTATHKAGQPPKAWNPRTLQKLLRDPDYAGHSAAYRWQVDRVDGGRRTRPRPAAEHVPLPSAPALVDAITWDAAQHRLDTNKVRSERSAAPKEDALLRGGFVVCGHCGGTMHVQRTRAHRPFYRCRGERGHPTCGRSGHTIPPLSWTARCRTW